MGYFVLEVAEGKKTVLSSVNVIVKEHGIVLSLGCVLASVESVIGRHEVIVKLSHRSFFLVENFVGEHEVIVEMILGSLALNDPVNSIHDDDVAVFDDVLWRRRWTGTARRRRL